MGGGREVGRGVGEEGESRDRGREEEESRERRIEKCEL